MPDTLAQKVRAKYPGVYDDLSDADLEAKVRAKFPGVYDDIPSSAKAATQPRKPAAAEDFMAPEDIANRDMTDMDVVKGFGKGVARSVAGLANMAAQSRMIPGLSPETLPPQVVDRFTPQYSNAAQELGGNIETATEVAAPMIGGARAAIGAIPSKARALANFRSAAAANSIPIDVELPGQIGLRVMQLSERGGGNLPRPVSQFMQWITHPDKPAMTYEVARDFSSGLGRLSRNDLAKMPPALGYEVASLHAALKKSVAEAAAKAGKGAEYSRAMTEYARAMRLKTAISEVLEGAKGALPKAIGGGAAGAGAGAGWWLTKKITDLLPGGD